ncbi:MAG: hypothetical protein AABY68_06180 [Pseudomonadota bacterium]
MAERIRLSPQPPALVVADGRHVLRIKVSSIKVVTVLAPISRPVAVRDGGKPAMSILQALMGPSGQVEVEDVETLPAGSPAEVENVGTPQHARLIFRIPQGDAGGQPIFIGAPDPLPAYPALVLDQITIGGETVYQLQVNVP